MGTIEGTLEQCHNIGELKDKIINACCCMYQIEDSGSTQYMKKCNFLYYWITDILIKEVDSSSFTSTLRTVIGALEKFLSEHECQILNPKNINKKSIKEEKIVYDFWHNRNPIQTLIKGSGSDCDKKYGNYLKEIESAYSEIYKICEKDTSGPYCIEFNSKCKQYGPTGQLDLKCPSAQQEGNLAHQGGLGSHSGKVPPEQDTITAEHSQSTDDTAPPEGSAVPTAAVSGGALVAIGLATMAFLLYKYTNVFSGIRNSSGGRSRSRRSGSSHFDTLTFNSTDTSSIDMSTVTSTSNLSTTEDNSTIHNGRSPPGRPRSSTHLPPRRRENNRRPGQRKNISYGRL